ncbi:MAG: cation-translocating P-type ATPase, partial [Oscillospiraceae bacterium]|nr:cation-translocating P-type ATPase [Oscillospiraceae bacterium]
MPGKNRDSQVRLNKVLPRVEATAKLGLTAEQARERLQNGYANVSPEPPERTVGQIVGDNVFTYFNLIFAILAACLIAVGSYRDLMFMVIILTNIVIGAAQELRSRRVLRKLSLITEPRAAV